MLITRIKASNFYSIKDDLEIDFTEGGEKEKAGYLVQNKKRISLINGFYGANASGKTTVLHIMDVLFGIMFHKRSKNIMQGNIDTNIPNIFLYKNKNINNINDLSILEVDFLIKDNSYNYAICIKNEMDIYSETLYKNKNEEIFSRQEDNIKYGRQYENKLGEYFKGKVNESYNTFFSYLFNETDILKDIKDDKNNILGETFLILTGKRDNHIIRHSSISILGIAQRYELESSKETKERMMNILKTGLSYFNSEVENIIIDTKDPIMPIGIKYKNMKDYINIFEESAGTKELFSHIYDIVRILQTGGIVIYDETSKYYHPDMEIALLNLFRDETINKNNAQIFFSSHNHETFDILNNDQAFICEKDRDTMKVIRVDRYDVKERDNIKRLYRLGSLGGLPDTSRFNWLINNLI